MRDNKNDETKNKTEGSNHEHNFIHATLSLCPKLAKARGGYYSRLCF